MYNEYIKKPREVGELKKKIIALALLLSIIIGLFIYFSFPVSSKELFPISENIGEIHLDFIRYNDNLMISFTDPVQFKNQAEIREILSILNAVSYNRELAYRPNISNTPNAIRLTIFYKNKEGMFTDLYGLDINDKGFLVSNMKKYKMINGKDEVFNQLYKWFEDNGVSAIKSH
jgi:hypothetical protein